MSSACWSRPDRKGCRPGRLPPRSGLPPNTLTFHFDRLRKAGLVTVRREGRSMIYAARFDTMNAVLAFLTENCCAGVGADCAAPACKPAPKRKRVKETA